MNEGIAAFAYLLPVVAAFIALFVMGMITAIGSIAEKCDGCGKEYVGNNDLLVHQKTCSHKDVASISKAA